MTKSIHDLTGPKVTDSKPNYVVDWEAVLNGTPKWGAAEGRLPRPVEVGAKDKDGNVRTPARGNLKKGIKGQIYPYGPYEIRTSPDGRDWWCHIELHRRARLKKYHRTSGGE